MLKLENVHQKFEVGTINEKHVLHGISLNVNEGDFITIIGGNGAGKSTMLNAVSGSNMITSGRILIDNVDLTKAPEYKRAKYIGRVFQDTRMGTASDLTIEENLAIAYRRGKPRTLKLGITNKEKELYKSMLADLDLGLDKRLKDKTRYLSGGQRQALTLLMATFHHPKLLLLDEHTAALDPKTAKKVLELTVKIVGENNLTALMVTHNMRDALRIGNRLIMLHKGQIILDISGEEKKKLDVPDLLAMFEKASGEEMSNDRMLLN
ncbi:MAG: ABC transporter ATP-binding protein [Clostridia bacterium]|nr:ABC transporter ATP-binding protein [Clostridia bacterium]